MLEIPILRDHDERQENTEVAQRHSQQQGALRATDLPLATAGLFCAPLVIHIYLGSYSRFIADDFCSSAIARSQGIFRGTFYWYINWNGRFSANFLDSLFGYLGPAATP